MRDAGRWLESGWRRGLAALAVMLAAASASAAGREVAGVTLPDTTVYAGKTLTLNGAGLRTRFMFKVYVIGLYLEHPSTDAAAILAADEMRRAELHLLRALTADEIGSAIATAFEQNAGAAMPRLQARLDRLKAMFPAVEKDEVVALTYVPGKGTVVTAKGADVGSIEGKDFADVLFAVWIGSAPVDQTLKQALLGAR